MGKDRKYKGKIIFTNRPCWECEDGNREYKKHEEEKSTGKTAAGIERMNMK